MTAPKELEKNEIQSDTTTKPKKLRKITSDRVDRLWTFEDVVNFLLIPDRTLRMYVATGKIPSVKIGRYRRFEPAEIKKWVSRKAA